MPSFKAVHKDGSEVTEYDKIDRSQLSHFVVIGDDGKPILVLHLRPTSRLIYRQRVQLEVGGKEKARIVLVGWQETRNGANFQSLTAIFPDHIEVTDRFDEGHPWFYPVNLRSEEKEVDALAALAADKADQAATTPLIYSEGRWSLLSKIIEGATANLGERV